MQDNTKGPKMSDDAKATMRLVLYVAVSLIVIISATAGAMRFLGVRDIGHATTDIILGQHSSQLQEHSKELDDHERRIDAAEKMQVELRVSQKSIENGVSSLQRQAEKQTDAIMELIKESAKTNAYVETIEVEVQ